MAPPRFSHRLFQRPHAGFELLVHGLLHDSHNGLHVSRIAALAHLALDVLQHATRRLEVVL